MDVTRARAARRRRRRGGDRGVPSRVPQLDRELHRQPAARRSVIADMRLHEHGLAHRRAADLELPAARTSGDYLQDRRRARARRRPRSRASRPRRGSALPAYYEMLDGVGDLLRELALETPPNLGGGLATLAAARAAPEPRASRARRREQRRDLLDLFTKSARRPARRLVRERRAEGGAGLRLGGRQLREPRHAGLRLRAAAPRVRRSQRQARAAGAMRSAAWARSRRRWRAACRDAGVAIERRRAGRARARRRRARGRASRLDGGESRRRDIVVANVNPRLLFTRLVDAARPAGRVPCAASRATSAAPARSA